MLLERGGVGRCAGSEDDVAWLCMEAALDFRRALDVLVLGSGDHCFRFEGFDGPGSGLLRNVKIAVSARSAT